MEISDLRINIRIKSDVSVERISVCNLIEKEGGGGIRCMLTSVTNDFVVAKSSYCNSLIRSFSITFFIPRRRGNQ